MSLPKVSSSSCLEFQTKFEEKLQELYQYAETRLIHNIRSFTKESNPLPVDKKQALAKKFILKLEPKISLWMNQLEVMTVLLSGFGDELNSKTLPIELVREKNINQLIVEKTIQKVTTGTNINWNYVFTKCTLFNYLICCLYEKLNDLTKWFVSHKSA